MASFEFPRIFSFGLRPECRRRQQVAFQAPGAGASTAWERNGNLRGVHLVNNWFNPDYATDKAWMKTEVMLEAIPRTPPVTQISRGVGNDQFRLGKPRPGRQRPAEPAGCEVFGWANGTIAASISKSMISTHST